MVTVTTFPGSPKTIKGAIVGIDIFNPVASVIVFQYNPAKLSRTLAAQTVGGEGGDRTESLRLAGPPRETITITGLEIDAADQLEKEDPVAMSMGIYPQLSALEMLIYPKSALVIANTVLMLAGTIEVIPPEAPLTLFIWGPKRVVPVRLTTFTINEEAYDVNLNPIRANVNLGLQVLNYTDFPVTHPAYHLFLAHQVVKEAMAVVGSLGNLGSVVSGNVSLI
jgi:hypothetical protein